jgi:hypothetical protein
VIEETDAVFPNNIVSLLTTRLQMIDEDLSVTRRPLRLHDPVQSIGVFASMWVPDVDSMEMRGLGASLIAPSEPTVQRYVVAVQAFVKDMDQERGLATHSVLSTMIRSILYRDQPLRVGLAMLSTEVLGVRERVLRWGITTQRFLTNELGESEWLYLSTVEAYVDTEIY